MVATQDPLLVSSDEEVDMRDVDLAELMGTPPTRRGRQQGLGGRHGKIPSKEPPGGRDGKRRSRHASKAERQKGRLDARAFKELDTTLQVLGIDSMMKLPRLRVTRSPHAPAVAEFPPVTPHRSSSGIWSPHRSTSGVWSPRMGRSTSDAAYSDVSLDSRESRSRRGSLLPPLAPAPPGQPLTPPAIRQAHQHSSRGAADVYRASGSLESVEQQVLWRQRTEWHANLDHLLEGDFASEDLDLAIHLARTKASDLKEQLRWWLFPPEPTWQSREQRLDWLSGSLEEARDIARSLQQQGALLGEPCHIATYIHIVKDIVMEFRGVSCVIGDAVSGGLREMRPGDSETKRAFKCAHRCIDLIYELIKRMRGLERLMPEDSAAASMAELGSCAAEVVLASLEAAAKLQDSLLNTDAFGFGSGDGGMVYGHELQDRSRMLLSVWVACGVLVNNVAKHWSEKRSLLYCEWCKLFLRAATAADAMQGSLRRASTDDISDIDCIDTPSGSSGVWGNASKGSTVTDEDLQAQAWLPHCLTAMLAEAEKAAEATLSWEGGADYEGGGTPDEGGTSPSGPPGEGAATALVDALSGTMYDLAHTGTKRVAALCQAPAGLACWALELLEEQACTAVVFVRDVDRGILGRGPHSLVHYEKLRTGTDLLVNGILRVRRLLKQKRAADADEPLPPLPAQPLTRYESTSSLASDWTSLSTSISGPNSRPHATGSHTPRYASPAPAPVRPEPAGLRPQQSLTSPPLLGSAEVPQPRTPPQAQPPAFSTLPHMRSSPPPPNPVPGAGRPPPAAVLPRPAASVSAAAIPIPLRLPPHPQPASALPAHSVWGRAASGRRPGSESASAVSDGGSSPGGDSAAALAAADRRRLERFAAGEPAAPGTATAGSSRSSSPATDSSLRVASRSPSFVFVQPTAAAQQVAGSPQQFPLMPRATAPAAVLRPAKPAAAPKPSPAAQHASFRGWAKLFAAPEPAPASSPTTPEDVVAAKFLAAASRSKESAPVPAAPAPPPPVVPFATAPPRSPFLTPVTVAPVAPLVSPYTSAAAPRVLSMPSPLASPFDTPTLQAASTASDSAFQSAAEDPSSLGSPQGPSSRDGQPSSGSPAQPASGDASAGGSHTQLDRHKEPRPSSSGGWKQKFRRGSRSREELASREPAPEIKQEEASTAKEKHSSRKSSRHGRHRPSRSSLKELFRGSGSHDSCANGKKEERRKQEPEMDEPAEPDEPARGVPSPPKGVLARFKDAFTGASHATGPLGPFDSATAAAARQMGRIRHATARPVQEAAAQVAALSRDTRDDEAWGKPLPAVAAAAAEGTQREDKRGGRRKHRHRERGRPGRSDRGRGSRERGGGAGQPPTIAALAKRDGLVMPWEGDPFWQIDWAELQPTLVKKLGNGSFGQVYEAYLHSAPMAVKVIKMDNDEDNLKLKLIRFKEEVDLQRRLSLHPNIVRFLGASCSFSGSLLPAPGALDSDLPQQSVYLAIVMELCRFGSLYKVIEYARRVSYLPADVRAGRVAPRNADELKLKARHLPCNLCCLQACPGWKLFHSWTTRLELAKQAAAGLAYMHSQNIVHRDMTSYNLLVTDKWECKLADFNLSRAIAETQQIPHSGQINSPEWSAPERLAGQSYGKAADVFSFGVVLWELVTLMIPWRDDDKKDLREAAGGPAVATAAGRGAANGGDQHFRDPTLYVINCVPKGDRLGLPAAQEIDPPLPELPRVLDLVQQCWAQDQLQRPTMVCVVRALDTLLADVRERIRTDKSRK